VRKYIKNASVINYKKSQKKAGRYLNARLTAFLPIFIHQLILMCYFLKKVFRKLPLQII